MWQGGFYVRNPDSAAWTLRLDMEGHEHTNRVHINGRAIGYLPSQTWADMWMSAALPVPAGVLRPGYNTLTVEVGRAIPDCQEPGNAWDELLFRRVRLERSQRLPSSGAAPALSAPPEADGVTITVVVDNNAIRPHLAAAWGFACLVQRGDYWLLFDTGADGPMLLANMRALGLNPSDLDAVLLSHAHGDHTGGLEAVLSAVPGITVYLPQSFPDVTVRRIRAQGAQVVEVGGPLEIEAGVWSTGPLGSGILEQALVVQTGSGLALITGCAHPGIVEMARAARQAGNDAITLVLGGFHLGGASAATVANVAAGLKALGVKRVAPCHCTGANAVAWLASAFGDGYQGCGAGLVLQEGK